MEVSRAEFARMAGVTKGAITQKIASNKLVLNSNKKIDTENSLNRAYLNEHQREIQKKVQKQNLFSIEDNSENFSVDLSQKKTMLQMTLGELIEKYTDVEGIETYIKIQKDLVTIEEKEQRLQEKRLQQLPRDFVIARLFGFQQQQTSRILDVPEASADQLQAIVLANPSDCRQKIIDYLRDMLSRAIGGAKEHIINELNSLKAKYSDDSESLSDKIDALMEANQ